MDNESYSDQEEMTRYGRSLLLVSTDKGWPSRFRTVRTPRRRNAAMDRLNSRIAVARRRALIARGRELERLDNA